MFFDLNMLWFDMASRFIPQEVDYKKYDSDMCPWPWFWEGSYKNKAWSDFEELVYVGY